MISVAEMKSLVLARHAEREIWNAMEKLAPTAVGAGESGDPIKWQPISLASVSIGSARRLGGGDAALSVEEKARITPSRVSVAPSGATVSYLGWEWLNNDRHPATGHPISADRAHILGDALRAAAEVNATLRAEIARLTDIIAARDARIAELDSELATRPVAFIDPKPEPLKHNPFRGFPGDSRRVGR